MSGDSQYFRKWNSISKGSKGTTVPCLRGMPRRVAPEAEKGASWGVTGNVTRFLAPGHLACQPRWLDLIPWVMKKPVDPMPGSSWGKMNQTARIGFQARKPTCPRRQPPPNVCTAPGPHLMPGTQQRASDIPQEQGASGRRPQLCLQKIL